jgi:hypothetical protein
MPESSVVVRPEPMDSGSYTASTRLQAAGLRPAITLFEQTAATVPLPRAPRPVIIADYGASTGHNSLLPIGSAIDVLRKRIRADQSVMVTHTDVPDNDFSALFRTLAEDPDTYLSKNAATYASAVGRSFYNQILPSDSVNLGWSSWAIQWLSRTPRPIPDHVQVAYSSDDAVRAAYARQAAQDWHEFIAFRGRELAPGGRLVIMTMALDGNGEFGYRPLLAAMLETLDELAAEDLLSSDELHRMTIPTVGRSETEFLAPFAPSGRFEQLSVEHLEVFDGEDRYWQQFCKDADAAAFGANWAAFLRASVFPTLASGLDGAPDDPRRAQFMDRAEAGIAQRMSAAPEQMQIPLAHLVLAKRARTR